MSVLNAMIYFHSPAPTASELKAMNTNHSNLVIAHQSCHCHSYSQGGRDNQTIDIYSLACRVNRNQVRTSLLLLRKDTDPTLSCNSHTARPSIPSAATPQGRASYPNAPMFSLMFLKLSLPAPLILLISSASHPSV